ncbi:MAG TPA: TIGR00725 family protein [Clostridia bacterium]|nr:TIGR00725 family protein [Clostridia bacterium]
MAGNASKVYIGVIGSNECSKDVYDAAREAGRCLARLGAIVITGGRGGVMEAVSLGVSECDGMCIGILPGLDRSEGNTYQTLSILTGIGAARNSIIVASSHAILAISGGYGTLSEIGLALKGKVPVVGVNTWRIEAPGGKIENGVMFEHYTDAVEGAKAAFRLGLVRAQRKCGFV